MKSIHLNPRVFWAVLIIGIVIIVLGGLMGIFSGISADNQIPTPPPVDNATGQGFTVNLKSGFNAVTIPDSVGPVKTDGLFVKRIFVFQFNRDGNENWQSTLTGQLPVLEPGYGYYFLNAWLPRAVTLPAASCPDGGSCAAPAEKAGIKLRAGWNLIANPADLDLDLDQIKVIVPAPGESNTCQVDCENQTMTLGDLVSGSNQSQRALETGYLVVDPTAMTASKAFQRIIWADRRRGEVRIRPRGIFWIFLRPSGVAIPARPECLKEYQDKKSEYQKGEIIVQFQPKIARDQAKGVLDNYGLSILREVYSYDKDQMLIVSVPQDKEFEWACRLKNNRRVKNSDLNYIVHAEP